MVQTMNTTGRLAGKVAVVTGGNSGIGLATAKRFAEEGAFVYVTGRRKPELDAAVAVMDGEVVGVPGDIGNLADLDALFAQIKAEKGRIDVLFANAGGGEFKALGDITEEHFDKTFNTNVKGTLFTVQKALPLMGAGGSIILTGSSAGSSGAPAFSVYAATKAAIRSFARNWILDLKGTGIRVNVVAPGPVATPGAHGLVDEAEREQFSEMLAAQVPLGRVGRPDEIASVALFLASDESSFVNGAEFAADGGAAQI
jgi:NAD(P)-dependent dehydrogenase (short-subunit alcohol dehydrogenase family)